MPLLAVYLVEQQLQLYSTSTITEDDTANRTMMILQMKIYMYINSVSSKMCSEISLSVYDTSYDMKPENYVGKGLNGLPTAGYRLILISLSVPLCALLSYFLSSVCYSITLLLCYFPFP
jgi:hypothetical protein